jgi:hypothetical protein
VRRDVEYSKAMPVQAQYPKAPINITATRARALTLREGEALISGSAARLGGAAALPVQGGRGGRVKNILGWPQARSSLVQTGPVQRLTPYSLA